MGLPISVLARGDTAGTPEASDAVRTVYAELKAVDAMFSPYREDSEVSRHANGELPLDQCDPVVQDVARRCEAMRDLTGGLFDATRPDGRWDPSGLVKGWAVERASAHLAAVDGLDWCLNAGGDVVVVCPSGEPIRVGIEDPLDPTRIAAVVLSSGNAVATSGTAARGAHLYDPRTGEAAHGSASLTVVGPSLETADVLATAGFVAGPAAFDLIARVPGYAALRIDTSGAQARTDNWPGAA